MSCLRPRSDGGGAPKAAATRLAPKTYGGWKDVWAERWTWDRVAKGTHTRANCISACAWDVYVKDGVVWREEQAALYQPPAGADVPDLNPRGCQKGACYSDLQSSA